LEDKVEKKNQSFTKGPKIKIINQEKKHQNKNPHKSYDNYEIIHGQHKFQGDGKEKKGKKRKTKVSTTTNNAITTTCIALKGRGNNKISNIM
jgi:hypothetical protein